MGQQHPFGITIAVWMGVDCGLVGCVQVAEHGTPSWQYHFAWGEDTNSPNEKIMRMERNLRFLTIN
jgi:hypothetical protein